MAYRDIDEMRNVDPRTVDRKTLVERGSVRLDPDAGYEERLREHVRQIKNPYCYLDGGVIVKLSFQRVSRSRSTAYILRGSDILNNPPALC